MRKSVVAGGVSGPVAAFLRYAIKLTRTPRAMTRADVDSLRAAGLSEAEVFEVALLTGYFNYTGRVGVGLGVEPE